MPASDDFFIGKKESRITRLYGLSLLRYDVHYLGGVEQPGNRGCVCQTTADHQSILMNSLRQPREPILPRCPYALPVAVNRIVKSPLAAVGVSRQAEVYIVLPDQRPILRVVGE